MPWGFVIIASLAIFMLGYALLHHAPDWPFTMVVAVSTAVGVFVTDRILRAWRRRR